MRGHDTVVHFAAESHVDRSIVGPDDFIHTNCFGTNVVMDTARRLEIARVVHIGTDEVYGSVEIGSSAETDPLEPRSPYSASKAGSDLIALSYHHTYGLPVSVTRCTNNFGPYQYPEKAIPLFTTNLLDGGRIPLYGDGLNERDWIYVDDHCAGVQTRARPRRGRRDLQHRRGQRDPEPRARRQAARRCSARVRSRCSTSPTASATTGGTPSTSPRSPRSGGGAQRTLDEALEATVAWYRDNRWWWEPLEAAGRVAAHAHQGHRHRRRRLHRVEPRRRTARRGLRGRRDRQPDHRLRAPPRAGLRTPTASRWSSATCSTTPHGSPTSSAARGAVVHLAANADVRFGWESPRRDLEQNVIVDAQRARGDAARRACPGCCSRRPARSTASAPWCRRPEDAPFPVQTSLYGASKAAAEGYVAAYAEAGLLPGTVFRFVSVLGPRYSHGHVIDFVRQLRADPSRLRILGDGTQRKSYMHVSDCVAAVVGQIEATSPVRGVQPRRRRLLHRVRFGGVDRGAPRARSEARVHRRRSRLDRRQPLHLPRHREGAGRGLAPAVRASAKRWRARSTTCWRSPGCSTRPGERTANGIRYRDAVARPPEPSRMTSFSRSFLDDSISIDRRVRRRRDRADGRGASARHGSVAVVSSSAARVAAPATPRTRRATSASSCGSSRTRSPTTCPS